MEDGHGFLPEFIEDYRRCFQTGPAASHGDYQPPQDGEDLAKSLLLAGRAHAFAQSLMRFQSLGRLLLADAPALCSGHGHGRHHSAIGPPQSPGQKTLGLQQSFDVVHVDESPEAQQCAVGDRT